MRKPLAPGLHVAATPIGNLGDVSDRLKAALGSADRVLCEDTRVTGRLLSTLGIPKPPLMPYHEHNAQEARPRIMADLEDGRALVLVSDAGTPLISDPGYRIVREARDRGFAVFAIPGPSALTAALSIAGAPTDRFSFLGFLPKGPGQRRALLEEMRPRRETLVFYETGPRIAASLLSIAEVFSSVRVSVARELTKLHEEVAEGEAADLAQAYEAQPPKGEIVLIVHPSGEEPAIDLDTLLIELLENERVKDAATMAAEMTGRPRKECYARALELKKA